MQWLQAGTLEARRRLDLMGTGPKGWEAALLHGRQPTAACLEKTDTAKLETPARPDAYVSDGWFLLSPHQGRRGPWGAHFPLLPAIPSRGALSSAVVQPPAPEPEGKGREMARGFTRGEQLPSGEREQKGATDGRRSAGRRGEASPGRHPASGLVCLGCGAKTETPGGWSSSHSEGFCEPVLARDTTNALHVSRVVPGSLEMGQCQAGLLALRQLKQQKHVGTSHKHMNKWHS